MKNLFTEAQAIQSDLVAWRRQIHKNPELGLELPKTSAFIMEKLTEMGYSPKLVGGSGVTATVGNEDGPCFLLRADADALPMQELAEVDFKSVNDFMHACGHDMHAAMLLGAAKLLKAHESELKGCVKLMFQPGEETLEGASALIADGILENPKVDAAAMIHVFPGAPTGLVAIFGGGVASAASDSLEIHVTGKGCHGAMPNAGVDPLLVMSHIHVALQSIVSREVAPSDTVVISICHMGSNESYNIIPETGKMMGTVRTFDPQVRSFVKKRIEEIARSVAETFRAEAKVLWPIGCPSVVVDGPTAETVRAGLTHVFGSELVPGLDALPGGKMSGAEDFAFVTEHVPAVMMALGTGRAEDGYTFPLHHPKVTFDETALCHGAATYAIAAMSWLEKYC